MSFKKILSLLLVFSMIFSFVACGSKSGKDDNDRDSRSSSRKVDDEEDERDSKSDRDKKKNKDEDDTDKNNVDAEDDEDEDNKSKDVDHEEDIGIDDPFKDFPKAVDLPKDYPNDIFPIYKNAHIYYANQEKRNTATVFTVWAVFNYSLETVEQYYVNLLKDAEGFEDQKSSFMNYYTGTYRGYKFELAMAGDENNKDLTSMTITLIEIPTAATVLESLNKGELPDEYPVSLFPVIDGGAIWDARVSESGGKTSFDLTIYTDKTIKEIMDFYDQYTESEDRSRSSDTDSFSMYGTKNGYYYDIYGDLKTEDNVQLIMYYISIDPIE